MRTTAILLALALAGCATPDAAQTREDQSQYIRTMVLTQWGPACEALGNESPTQAFKDCVMKLFDQDFKLKMAQSEEKAARNAAFSQALKNAGQSFQRQPIQTAPVAPYPSQTHCSISQNGRNANCINY